MDMDFLKSIKLLYVEDDTLIRTTIEAVLRKIIGEVVIAEDGMHGYEYFREAKYTDKPFDIIISDINMPNMSGLQMLESIRALDKDIPIIFVTAHNETDFLIKAIELGVYNYAVKPINTSKLTKDILDICKRKYQEKLLELKQKEIDRYVDVIDNTTIVSKYDLQKRLTFVNSIYEEVSGYSKEELLDNPLDDRKILELRNLTAEAWSGIEREKFWKGRIKHISKDDEEYYVAYSIFPMYDDKGENITEYISIGFLTTQEENAKREFRLKVMRNMQEQRLKEKELKEQVKDLEAKVNDTTYIELIESKLKHETEKSKKMVTQLDYYEGKMKQIKFELDATKTQMQTKLRENMNTMDRLKKENDKFRHRNEKLEGDFKLLNMEVQNLSEQVKQQNKQIKNYKDVIVTLDEKIKAGEKRSSIF